MSSFCVEIEKKLLEMSDKDEETYKTYCKTRRLTLQKSAYYTAKDDGLHLQKHHFKY